MKRQFTQWERGTFVLYLRTGAEITVSGRIRFEKHEDGFSDYDLDTTDLPMLPHFSDLVAVGKV